jgi:uncharacterized protein (UPF0335 family)
MATTKTPPLKPARPRARPASLQTEARSSSMSAKLKSDESEVGGIAADRLRSIVERIERLEEERKALGSDIKDIYSEAKSAGFDVKVLRTIIRLRKQEPADVEEQETLLDLYRQALGM